MSKKQKEQLYSLTWENIQMNITYVRNYVAGYDHIDVYAKERLPITETGYRSIFIYEEEILESGGVLEFIEQLLILKSQTREWLNYKESSKQISLF